jgi:hypothetical protein
MTDVNSIIAVVAGSITAMGGLLVAATMMEQWMKHDPLGPRVEATTARVSVDAE